MSSLKKGIPIELIEKIEADQCVLFIGPNASLAEAGYLGPPGPATLSGEIALRLDHLPTNITLPWVAQLYEDRFGEHDLRDFVAEQMENPDYCPTPMHQQAAALPCSIIVSTAYDRLFDQILLEQNRTVKYVLNDDDLPAPNTPQLIKLYGSAARPATMRLTEENLENLFADLPGIADFLRSLSRTQSLLFIGYHLGDAMFRRLFSELRGQIRDKAPAAYLVQTAPEKAEIALWKRRGLIALQADPCQFLYDLRTELASRKNEEPVELPQILPPKKLDAESHRTHSETVAQLLGQLGIGGMTEGGFPLKTTVHNLSFAAQLMAEHPRIGGSASDFAAQEQSAQLNEAKLLLQYGNAQWAQRNHVQARQHFEEALKQAPDYIEAYLNLHYLLAEIGEFELSLDVYRQYLTNCSHHALLPQQYEIQAVLGMNTLGIIYQAHDTKTDRLLLVTTLKNTYERKFDALENFKKSLSRFQHPRFSRLVEAGTHRGRGFIAYEYTAGSMLADLLQGSPLPLAQALSILEQIAEALEYAHANNMPYLALKPSSIFLSETQGVQLLYLGETELSKELNGQAHSFPQTTDYMAPEQRAGDVGDRRSDVYTFGTIAYEMLTGHLPGVGALEQVSSLNPETDEAMDLLTERARAIDPVQRFSSVSHIRQELRQITLAHQPRGICQIARWALIKISSSLEWLATSPRWVVLIFLLAGLWTAAWHSPWLQHGTYVRAAVLALILMMANIFPASLLSFWQLREVARTSGFGSIIHISRGIGGCFGTLTALFILYQTRYGSGKHGYAYWGEPFQLLMHLENWSEFLTLLIQTSIVTLMATMLVSLSSNYLGKITRKSFNNYLLGIYGGFLFWFLGVLILTWVIEIPPGLVDIRQRG